MNLEKTLASFPRMEPLFAGDLPVTVDALLCVLKGRESHLSSGVCTSYTYSEIAQLIQLRLAVALAAYGKEHAEVIEALADLGFNFQMWSQLEDGINKYAEAELAYMQAFVLAQQVFGLSHYKTDNIRHSLVALLKQTRHSVTRPGFCI